MKHSIHCHCIPDPTDGEKFGPGAFRYIYKGPKGEEYATGKWPEDVIAIVVRIPVVHEGFREWTNGIEIDFAIHPATNPITEQSWCLFGTVDRPTVSPALDWLGRWQGTLINGLLTEL